MGLPPPPLVLTAEQREVLEKLSGSRIAAHREVQQARVLLLASEGVATTQIAARAGLSPATVASWRGRVAQGGQKGLARAGAPRGAEPTHSPPKGTPTADAT